MNAMYKINYKVLYCDFINEQDSISTYKKVELTRKIIHRINHDVSFKHLYKINQMIRDSLKCTDNKPTSKSVNVYDKAYILDILSYQKKNKLSNRTISLEFKLSRNTVAAWKKQFL